MVYRKDDFRIRILLPLQYVISRVAGGYGNSEGKRTERVENLAVDHGMEQHYEMIDISSPCQSESGKLLLECFNSTITLLQLWLCLIVRCLVIVPLIVSKVPGTHRIACTPSFGENTLTFNHKGLRLQWTQEH